ncbi:MAG: hypothetical protein ACFE0Q_01905 [Anaerolineae bacterium]
MASFLIAEREQAGWRFLTLWLLATVIGFSLGIALELLISGAITLYLSIPLSALGQATIINRHLSVYLPWVVGTSLFGWVGIVLASSLFGMIVTTDSLLIELLRLMFLGFVGGTLAGIPQWFYLREWLPQVGIWWVFLHGLAWALFFLPGIITGVILMRFITADKVPMYKRHYQISGEF